MGHEGGCDGAGGNRGGHNNGQPGLMNRCGFRRPYHGNRGGFDNDAGGQNFNPGHGAGSAGGTRGGFGSESGSFLGGNLQRGGELQGAKSVDCSRWARFISLNRHVCSGDCLAKSSSGKSSCAGQRLEFLACRGCAHTSIV